MYFFPKFMRASVILCAPEWTHRRFIDRRVRKIDDPFSHRRSFTDTSVPLSLSRRSIWCQPQDAAATLQSPILLCAVITVGGDGRVSQTSLHGNMQMIQDVDIFTNASRQLVLGVMQSTRPSILMPTPRSLVPRNNQSTRRSVEINVVELPD
jgi:hypothetical protein